MCCEAGDKIFVEPGIKYANQQHMMTLQENGTALHRHEIALTSDCLTLALKRHLGCSVCAAVARGRTGVLLWGSCVTALWPMENSAASAASTATLAAATLLTASAVHASQVQPCNGLAA